MIPAEELRPSHASAMADLRDIPLSELPALGMDVLGAAIGRVLPDPVAGTVRAGAFQSSI